MEIYSTRSFNQDLLSRTQLLAGRIYEHLSTKRESQLGKCPIQELIRCSIIGCRQVPFCNTG